MLNWAGFSADCVAADFDLGKNLTAIGTAYLKSSQGTAQTYGNISSSISKEAQYRSQAKAFRASAESATKSAGLAQEAGRQAIESTLKKLGDAKSAIVTGAAGSGIDVTSRTVNKTLSDTVKSAYSEAEVQARNEQQTVQAYLDAATSNKINAIWADSNANQEKITQTALYDQIRLNQRMLRTQEIAGYIKAGSDLIKDMAKAGATLMG